MIDCAYLSFDLFRSVLPASTSFESEPLNRTISSPPLSRTISSPPLSRTISSPPLSRTISSPAVLQDQVIHITGIISHILSC